jgi:hypothetical protein
LAIVLVGHDHLFEQGSGMIFPDPTMEKWEYRNIRFIQDAARRITG